MVFGYCQESLQAPNIGSEGAKGALVLDFQVSVIGFAIPHCRNFNCIMGSHKKRGGRMPGDNIEHREFRDFISNAGLIDLSYFNFWFI